MRKLNRVKPKADRGAIELEEVDRARKGRYLNLLVHDEMNGSSKCPIRRMAEIGRRQGLEVIAETGLPGVGSTVVEL